MMKQLVLVLVLILVVACSSSTQPDLAPRPEPVVIAPADSAAAAPDAIDIPDAFVAPPPDASIAADAGATSGTTEKEGRGSCRVDKDCVLSSYQSGCCVQACQPNAISAKVLAAAQAKEDCVAFRQSGKPCPPPAPCPVYKTHPIAAKCKAGTCYAVMAPGPWRP